MKVDISSLRSEKISSKDTHKPFNGALFELSGSDYKRNAPLDNSNLTTKSSDPRSSETLSSADLVTAVSLAWKRARQPLSTLLLKTSPVYKPEIIHGGGDDIYSTDGGTYATSTSDNSELSSHYVNNDKISSNLAKESVEHLKPNQTSTRPHLSYEYLPFWRILLRRAMLIDDHFSENCIFRAGNLPALGGIYGWMSESALGMPERESSVETADERTSHFNDDECLTNPASNSSIIDSQCNLEVEQSVNMMSGEISDFKMNHTCSENHMIQKDTCSGHVEGSGSTNQIEDAEHENQKDKSNTISNVDSSELESNMSAKKKNTLYALAKHEHAFAGAMAGIFVSLCLHPVDTIKTVIQSCCADRRSLSYVSRSIISERGLAGLYRGISTNIVASAPISALYTFTYESAKKSFVPHLPKEYHSLAHCMAGASASIATSFIFTPSERIKQQMQVGSHYKNSWKALRGIVEKGGLASLYAGWGAVLCRNIPHSVIKFYTYESLKQAMVPSVQHNAQSTTTISLVCGGLAATTASLFSTPFDVVKTRLQTQIPGSVTCYNGVLNTLLEIGKNEGLKGLYRGLTPRLVMYMIHGALFFASYESFKQLFLSDDSQPSTQKTEHGEAEDVSMITPQLMLVSA